jgi:hypothetical protein
VSIRLTTLRGDGQARPPSNWHCSGRPGAGELASFLFSQGIFTAPERKHKIALPGRLRNVAQARHHVHAEERRARSAGAAGAKAFGPRAAARRGDRELQRAGSWGESPVERDGSAGARPQPPCPRIGSFDLVQYPPGCGQAARDAEASAAAGGALLDHPAEASVARVREDKRQREHSRSAARVQVRAAAKAQVPPRRASRQSA